MSLTKEEALERLGDGHAIWSVEGAQKICKVVGVEFDPSLVRQFYSDHSDPKGARMYEEGSMGVYSLGLSAYIARQLGVEHKARSFFGRGSQAREYARLIRDAIC